MLSALWAPTTPASLRDLEAVAVLRRIWLQQVQRRRTDDCKTRSAQRAGIEGTRSQAVRVFDVRQARSLGQAKTHLQHCFIAVQHSFIAVALNLARLCAWFGWATPAPTRVTPFQALFLAAA